MSKINIIKKEINVEALIDAIDMTPKKTKYIIVNSWTHNKLIHLINFTENWNGKGISYIEIRGIPIIQCDKLEDGEVELI